ncbi:MAG: penicillin acylase family protein [Thermodesulfobacteriota bacterium]|nr:penicillin acylase family protein [Thermodesulfobacteriota bacterium]
MKRSVLVIFCFLSIVSFSFTDSFSKTSTVTIYRDDYGAPHIFAQDLEGLFYGFGYATAKDRLFQIDMLRRTYWGRVSEVHGAKFLEFDKAMRRDNLTRAQVKDQVEALDKEYQKILRSFADGINAFIREIQSDPPQRIPAEFHKFGIDSEKWEVEDVAAVFISVMGVFMDFSREMENNAFIDFLIRKHGEGKGRAIFRDFVWVDDPHTFSTIPYERKKARGEGKDEWGVFPRSLAEGLAGESNAVMQGHAIPSPLSPGEIPSSSYAFVVSPEKSATGNALLMGGPQFGFHLPSDLYEAGLHGPGIKAVGSTLVGYPFLMFGQTEKTAFSSTAGVDNITDYFEEKLNPKNPRQYWFMGKWRPMETRREVFRVKSEEPKEYTFSYTIHGPVVRMDEAKGVAYAKQLSCKEDYLSGFVSFFELMKAQTPDEFKKAASIRSLSVNVFYADTSGNIGFFHKGKYPKRNSKVNPLFPTPGTGEFEWEGFLPQENNPHVVNPQTGIVANWNNKPARDWPNGDLGGTLGGVAGWGLDHRVTLLMDSVKGKEKISVDDLKRMIQDITFSHLWAQRFKPFLMEAGKRFKSSDPRVEKALEVLATWNDRWNDENNDGLYDHPGLTIFNAWWDIVLKNTFEDELGEYWTAIERSGYGPYNWERRKRYPGGHPVFLRALLGEKAPNPLSMDYFNGKRDEVLVKSLSEALDRVEKKFGSPDMATWKLPVTPMSYAPTTIHGIPSTPEKVKGTFFMERGTENHVVELKREGAEGVMVVPPGTSGFIKPDGTKSPHYEDQFEMFNKFEYKPLLLKEDAIKAKAKSKQELTYTFE